MTETTAERFARLQAKENELRQREKALKKQDVVLEEEKPYNFPPFFSFMHHDINGDIPLAAQWTVRIAFFAQIGWAVLLILNFIGACSTGSIKLGSGGYNLGSNIVFSIIIAILGVPCAFKLNYMKFYDQASKNAIKGTYFAIQGIFIVVNGYAFVGLKNQGLMGIITAIDAIASGNGFCKAIVLIDTALWAASTLVQVFLFGRIMVLYKNGGNAPPPQAAPAAAPSQTAGYGPGTNTGYDYQDSQI